MSFLEYLNPPSSFFPPSFVHTIKDEVMNLSICIASQDDNLCELERVLWVRISVF